MSDIMKEIMINENKFKSIHILQLKQFIYQPRNMASVPAKEYLDFNFPLVTTSAP